MSRRRISRHLPAVVLVLAVVFGTGVHTASADPVSDKEAQAKRIATERERLTQRAEQLNERSKQASDELTTLAQQLAASNDALDTQRAVVGSLQQRLAALAVNSYVRGDDTGGLAGLVAADGANEAGLRRGYAPVVLGDQTNVLDQLRAAHQDIGQATRDIESRLARQRQLVAAIAADRAEIERTQARLTALAGTVNRDLADAVAAEQARQEAAAEAAAAARQKAEEAKQAAAARQRAEQARVAENAARLTAARTQASAATASGTGGRTRPNSPAPPAVDGAPTEPPLPIPPTSPAAAIAVAEALRQLGKPYVFGTNGPDTFDCSGLTQWAWARAGVGMPHYTVSQYNAFPHVGVDQLQPGDLVFFNVDLGHMGMYIGNGTIVQAPRTGDVVKISPLRGRNVVGAVRPG